MADNKKSFIAYCDWKETFDALPDEKAGQLIKHLFAYVNDENPETDDILINAVFANIKHTLKRDLIKYEKYLKKQAVNGAKGGRPKKTKETQKTQPFLEKPKKADSDSDSDSIKNNIDGVLDDFKNQIGGPESDSWRDSFYMKLKYNKGCLSSITDEFIIDFKLREHKLPKNLKEFRNHLLNWVNVQDGLNKFDKYKIKSNKSLSI